MASKECRNCGHANDESDRFCSECGARLTPVAAMQDHRPNVAQSASGTAESSDPKQTESLPPGPTIPPPVTPSFAQGSDRWSVRRDDQQVDDDWKMSDLGPPPNQRRPVWKWILLALLALFLLCCVGGVIFFTQTETGQQLWSDAVATAEAISTEQAGN